MTEKFIMAEKIHNFLVAKLLNEKNFWKCHAPKADLLKKKMAIRQNSKW
jgi:hypothetical protein